LKGLKIERKGEGRKINGIWNENERDKMCPKNVEK
jgi:hypothetical protein